MSTTNLPARQDPKEVVELRGYLEQQRDRITQNIRGELDTLEIINVICELARGDSRLRRCEPETVLVALLQACQLGLTLQKNLGHAYLIPRKNGALTKQAGRDVIEATFLIGYKGLIHMIRKGNPNIHTVKAVIVYSEEVEAGRFNMTAGSTPIVEHKPFLIPPPLADYVGVYSIVEFKDGSKTDYEWMSREDVEKCEAVSTAGEAGPWKGPFRGEMIKKSVTRRHSKRLELKPEIAVRIRDNEVQEMQYGDTRAPAMPMPRRRTESLSPPPPEEPPDYAKDLPPICDICTAKRKDNLAVEYRLVPGGVSSKTSRPYPAFWACPNHKICNGKTINAKDHHENLEKNKVAEQQPIEQPPKAQEPASETLFHEEPGWTG